MGGWEKLFFMTCQAVKSIFRRLYIFQTLCPHDTYSNRSFRIMSLSSPMSGIAGESALQRRRSVRHQQQPQFKSQRTVSIPPSSPPPQSKSSSSPQNMSPARGSLRNRRPPGPQKASHSPGGSPLLSPPCCANLLLLCCRPWSPCRRRLSKVGPG